ncbi:MAG: hypothetical protein LC808_16020, partial [Actinobacteria bacterium]|nr:hypothetical protein [Actinomycetota bacterium]
MSEWAQAVALGEGSSAVAGLDHADAVDPDRAEPDRTEPDPLLLRVARRLGASVEDAVREAMLRAAEHQQVSHERF